MKKWIFFDLGSTLIDETEAYDRRAREMIIGTGISFEEFDNKRIELAKKGFDGNSEAINYFRLKKTPWHSEVETLYPGTKEALIYLRNKGYPLGIIANQNPGTSERLAGWDLRDYFDVIAGSAELGVSKPDKQIFEKAFAMANCTAADSIMVGDRLDNDIIPAKSLGMTTVWVRKGLSRYQDPSLGIGIADYLIDDIADIRNIL